MPLGAVLATAFNFIKPFLKKVGAAVCKVGGGVLTTVGETLSSNASAPPPVFSGFTVKERGSTFNDIIETQVVRESENVSTVKDFMELGMPQNVAEEITKRINLANEQAQSITTTGNVQVECLPYSDLFELSGDDATYLPITAYTFYRNILVTLDKYDYVLPLFLFSELKNTSDDNGVRLDVAVTTAYENPWLKAKSSIIMNNLQPISIDNKSTITDLQALSFEDYKTYKVKDLKERYTWLNGEALDMLFSNRFTQEEIKANPDETTRNPENALTFRETTRQETKWIPSSVYKTMCNGFINQNSFSDKCQLYTGYAVKPRLDDNSEITTVCKVAIKSYLVLLGLQNAPDLNQKMLMNPEGIDIDVPVNPPSESSKQFLLKTESITPKQVQNFASSKAYTIATEKYLPSVVVDRTNCNLFEIWKKRSEDMKLKKEERDEYAKLLRHGIMMIAPLQSDSKGFTIRE
jgi:hypothetical protein